MQLPTSPQLPRLATLLLWDSQPLAEPWAQDSLWLLTGTGWPWLLVPPTPAAVLGAFIPIREDIL